MGISLDVSAEMRCRSPSRRRASSTADDGVGELYRTTALVCGAEDDDVDATTMSLLQNAGRLRTTDGWWFRLSQRPAIVVYHQQVKAILRCLKCLLLCDVSSYICCCFCGTHVKCCER